MEDQQLEQIEGTIEDIIFENSDSGYVVFELSGEGRLTVVCGTLGELHVGQSVICRGRYENHATYGRQFHAAECLTDMPKDIDAVYAFLASRSLPYVGPATARKIIETFGASALDVIANDPARLTQIKGISADKADRIQQEFKRMFGMRELIAYLAQFEIGPRRAMEVFRAFGPGAVQAVASNPYLLCGEPLQLDFRHADSIAAYYQMEGDSPQRLEAALLRTLRHNAGNGHTCLPRERLVATASAFIHQPPEKLTAALEHCLETGQLETRTLSAGEYIYLPDLLAAEEAIAARLAALARRDKQTARHLDQDIQVLEAAQGFAYAPEQREAIRQAVTENCLVLTGGPGTGKTTTLNAIIHLLKEAGEKVFLAAPTGRAAKRMSEATGRPARTIHRLLEYAGEEGRFLRNEQEPLDCAAVVVDEMSMVDIFLFRALLRALRPGTRLVMVGDKDQLPSVGAGNVLKDILACGAVPSVTLTEVFRQAASSMIVQNAHRINRGEYPIVRTRDTDFFLERKESMRAAVESVVQLVTKRLPRYLGVDPVRGIQVMAPMKRSDAGVYALNAVLQQAINPPAPEKPELRRGETVFRVGDKVMQVKNNYDMGWTRGMEHGLGVFNGDIGYISAADLYNEELTVAFDDGREALYALADLEELELAYCVSVHKSQGSEFDCVVLPLVSGPRPLMTRNLLYTAVTRARRLAVVVGREACVRAMVDNNYIDRRFSALDERLAAWLTN